MATTSPDRILTLDVIRGLAVMGIFSVNIVGMAMSQGAYFYPPEFGFDGVGDRVMWTLNWIFVDGRFRSLFSILFGASMIVVIDRAVAAGRKGWQVHYPRMIVLLLFGLAHYYLLWWGDILANYALVGMAAYVLWRLGTKWLLVAAIAVLLFASGREVAGAIPQWQVMERIEAGTASAEEKAEMERMLEGPPPEVLAEFAARDRAAHASIPAHLENQLSEENRWRPFQGVTSYGIETLGLMWLGMALLKSGFLTGAWTRRRYAVTAAVCLGLNLALHAVGAWLILAADFAPQVYFPWRFLLVTPFFAVGAVGYAALFILLLGHRSAIADRIAAVGRTAFTNYLGPTLIGTLIFFGTFGGLYGELSRGEAWLIVPPVWALMLIWSKWWLDRFRYGPFEWAWRSLSRWERQPMRRALPASAAAPGAA